MQGVEAAAEQYARDVIAFAEIRRSSSAFQSASIPPA